MFNHILMLSDREEICSIERDSLRKLGMPFIQHLNQGKKALELINANRLLAKKRGQLSSSAPAQLKEDKRSLSKFNHIKAVAGENNAKLWQNRHAPLLLSDKNYAALPVDLVICTERLIDAHSLNFLEELRSLPGQAKIAVLVFPDSTRFWREAEKLAACCMSRPYTLKDLQTILHRSKYLAQKIFAKQDCIARKSDSPSLLHPQKISPKAQQQAKLVAEQAEFLELNDNDIITGENISCLLNPAIAEDFLGLAKPEPLKREPFALVDDSDFIEFAKRSPFPLVDDPCEEGYSHYLNKIYREPFPLVDDEPRDFNFCKSSFVVDDNNKQDAKDEHPHDSNSSSFRGKHGAALDRSSSQDHETSNDSQEQSLKNTQTNRAVYSFSVAQDLLMRGHHINAAQAFLSCFEIIEQGKKVEQVISCACQYTGAPKDNLRSMCKAMQLIGEKAVAKKLEHTLQHLYGSGTPTKTSPIFSAFPILEDILSIAQMTFSAWRSPKQASNWR